YTFRGHHNRASSCTIAKCFEDTHDGKWNDIPVCLGVKYTYELRRGFIHTRSRCIPFLFRVNYGVALETPSSVITFPKLLRMRSEAVSIIYPLTLLYTPRRLYK